MNKAQHPTHEELMEAAKPLLDILYEYYDSLTTIIMSQGHIEIVRGDIGTPLPLRD